MRKKKRTHRRTDSRWFHTGSGIAARFGFYLFESGDPHDPQWEVKSLKTGKTLATYYPASGRCLCGGEKSTERNWHEVFARASRYESRHLAEVLDY